MMEMNVFKLLIPAMLFFLIAGNGLCENSRRDQDEEREKILAEFKIEKSIIYKAVDGRNLELVLFLPKGVSTEKMPVMLYTHGGGWRGGNIYKILKPSFLGTLRQMRDSGIACAAVKYRLTKGDVTAVDSVEDCKDAARFLVENGNRWNLDAKRMGVWGGSAGGHLALMTALGDNDLFFGSQELKDVKPEFKCVVSYYPLTSFERTDLFKGSNFEDPSIFIPMLGGKPKDQPEVAAKLSPVKYVTPKMPPVLLIHGEKDKILPISQSELFLEAAKDVQDRVTLMRVRGARHSLGGKHISPSMEEVNKSAADFIIKHLKIQ